MNSRPRGVAFIRMREFAAAMALSPYDHHPAKFEDVAARGSEFVLNIILSLSEFVD